MEKTIYYVNNQKRKYYQFLDNNDDVIKLALQDEKVNISHFSKGYEITLPTNKIKLDLTLNKLVSKYYNNDFMLTLSFEDKNSYEGKEGFKIYHDDWLTRYIGKSRYLDHTTSQDMELYFKENNIKYTYEPIISDDIVKGFEVEEYDLVIKDHKNIKYPYYNIAIIKKKNSLKDFYLFVFKSRIDLHDAFTNILKSFKTIKTKGEAKNYPNYKVDESTLDEATLRYYKKLKNQDYTGFGFFRYSMYDLDDKQIERIRKINEKYENEYFDYKMDLMPTYTHIQKIGHHDYFPLKNALIHAGGDGFNNKRVLQFTLQFTASNNTNLHGYNPTLDVYRGKYDEYFKKMAKDIKEYGKPVLFRLNNEMNTDWTSYCGIVNLLDPDIFKKTWQRMANIFYKEGVRNVLYIFNGNALSFPYSAWGDVMNYFPGSKYVHILGLTYYEFNNYKEDVRTKSFASLYQKLYDKNKEFFKDYIAIISEFACGSGGELSGRRYRNQKSQAQYIKDMFEVLISKRDDYEFAKQIKGAIWFSCNDANNKGVFNQLEIDDNLKDSIKEFKEGFKLLKEKKEKENEN